MRAVNLLPADRRKGAKAERSKPKLTPLHGIALAILVGGGALGYYGHSIAGQAAEQQAQAESLAAQATTLQQQIETLKQAQGADPNQPSATSYDSNLKLVTGLAQARVNWANVIISLSRVAPAGVWVEKMSITTPSTAATAASTGTTGTTSERPAAIVLTARSLDRTSAALFISRLDAIPGFDQPRLQGGINPKASGSGTSTSGVTTMEFTVEIPVDDGIFGPNKPGAANASSGSAAAPGGTTPAAGGTTPTSTPSTN